MDGLLPTVLATPRKAFSPKQISGLVLWLRADKGITLNGSNVSTWADQSGNGNNVTQATANKQPLYVTSSASIRNKPVLDFDGSNDQLQGDFAAALTGAKNWTMIAVIQADTLTGTRSPISVGAPTDGYDFIINFSGTGKREIVGKAVGAMQDDAATTDYEIWTATRDNAGTATTVLRINGITKTLDVPTGLINAPGVSVSIGANFTVSFFDGKAAEFMIYNNNISTNAQNITKIHRYLNRRYGITIS